MAPVAANRHLIENSGDRQEASLAHDIADEVVGQQESQVIAWDRSLVENILEDGI
jgi:hypothetical protein